MHKNRTRILIVSLIAFGCSAAAVGHAPAIPPQTPNLCDLDGGRWCTSCGHPGEIACPPQEAAGWLCCSGGVCVAVKLAGDCTTGTVGWCANYTEEKVGSSTVATCHDGP